MLKRIGALAAAMCIAVGAALADTAPVKMQTPPEAIETQAEGELETYGLTFPEDMPLAARNFVRFARAEYEKNGGARLPKCNEYTRWYYHDKREIGWCSVFQLYCAYHSGLQLVRYRQDTEVQPGSIITTSGAGGVFPGDLLIGRVDSVERSNADSSYYAILTPYVDVTEVTDVFVVTDFDGKGDVTTGLPETNNKDEEDPAQTASKGNE